MNLFQTPQQKQALSQQGILAQQLIAMPAVELELFIRQEMAANPALEEDLFEDEHAGELEGDDALDVPDYLQDELTGYKTQADGYTEAYRPEVRDEESLHDMVGRQLGLTNLSEKQKMIGMEIIGSLDESGMFGSYESGQYVPEVLSKFTKKLNEKFTCSEQEVEQVLRIIQNFDPAGVAARDTRECVLIQLDKLPQNRVTEMAMHVVEFGWNDMLNGDNRHLAKVLNLKTTRDLETLEKSLQVISKMSPKPFMLNEFSRQTSTSHSKVPDFTVSVAGDGFVVSVNDKVVPNLFISQAYAQTVEQNYRKKQVEDQVKIHRDFVKRGRDLIQTIAYRNQKLQAFIQLIASEQKEYFMTGDPANLKPLTMTEVSSKTDLSVNTISRMAKDKIIDTDFGFVKLRDMFDRGLDKDKNSSVARSAAERIMEDAISSEDKTRPLTDVQLADILKKELSITDVGVKTVKHLRKELGYQGHALRTDLVHELGKTITRQDEKSR